MAPYKVPAISQTTAELCWEACGHMMWFWRHKNDKLYAARAGHFLTVKTGLIEAQMDVFYRQLGLRSLASPRGANLRHALGWTPVIFTSISQATGHAMVAVGFHGASYDLVNPCALLQVDFDSNAAATCSAGTAALPAVQVEGQLGRLIWYW